jgi:hypothetical protein
MASARNPAGHDVNSIGHAKWSGEEKAVARRAFRHALGQELEAVIREAKNRAARIKEPSELWDLEEFLTQRRQEIDRKYDYRYSVLLLVFANLLREGCISEEDLRGLSQDKLEFICRARARA